MTNRERKIKAKKRTFAVFSATAIAVTAVAAASCKKMTGGAVTLTVWCSQMDTDLAKEIAEDFKKAHAETEYEFRFVAQGEDEVATKILTDVEAAPDVFSFSSDQILKLIAGDALSRIGGDRLTRIKENNDEKSVDSATVSAGGEESVYAFPYTDNTFFLYYNKQYLNEEDILSLDGILAKCSANKKFAMPLNDGWYNTSFYFGAGLGYEVTYNDSFAETKITTDFGGDTGKKVTQALYETVSNPKVLPDANDSTIAAGFSDGTVIAATSGIWNKKTFSGYLKDNFGVAKLPTYTYDRDGSGEEQKQLTAFAGYKLMGVGQYSKNKTAALDFAEFYTNKENQIRRFKDRGFVPTNKEARGEEDVQSDACAKAIETQLKYSKTQKNVPSTLWLPMQGLGNAMITAATTGSAFKLETELASYVKAIEKTDA